MLYFEHVQYMKIELAIIRAALAAVWLHQGLWSKLLRPNPRHQEIVAAAGLPGALLWLGTVETATALWVLSGWSAVGVAWLQSGLIVGMNAGGLLRARRYIPDPAGMLLQNAAFLVLAWVAAGVLRAA
jgi:hypothetical protein